MEQKSQVTNLLDKLSPSDLEKIQTHQASTDGAYPVDNEWLLLAEFARAYGWQAYREARQDEISMVEMLTLIEANRKLEWMDHYKNAEATFIGSASAQAGKKASSTFRTLTKGIIKKTKVHEQ